MSSVSKITGIAKKSFSDKDYNLICKLSSERRFDEIGELVSSEIIKEYRKCTPEKMTDRYCQLQEISFILIKFDAISNENDCNYNVD